jgi:cell division protein FtsB
VANDGKTFLPLAMLATAVVSVPWMMLRPDGLPRLRSLQTELASIRTENAQLGREIAYVRAEVKGLREDPASVERIARDQLGMIRKSEVVFQFAKRERR